MEQPPDNAAHVASPTCHICDREGLIICLGCCSAVYCSEAHQRKHWREHKPQCRIVKWAGLSGVGGHLAAQTDFEPGT